MDDDPLTPVALLLMFECLLAYGTDLGTRLAMQSLNPEGGEETGLSGLTARQAHDTHRFLPIFSIPYLCLSGQ